METPEAYRQRREAENRVILEDASLVTKRFFAIDSDAYRSGELSAKHKELIGLAASAVLRCNDCISYHVDRAWEEGASRQEIAETLDIALIVGGSIVIPHLRHAMGYLAALEHENKEEFQ